MKKLNILPIVVMYLLFFMIAFVTNLCNPMAVIVKSNFAMSNFAAQLGNAANFIAYAVMGIPAGMLLKKVGYRKTALIAILVGFVGVFLQYMSGWSMIESFWVYLVGAFTAGCCMCMLNTVVNPMLHILGGGGNRGNQLVQFGGVCGSTAAVLVTIIMGSLIADASKAQIADATPALMIALGVFAFAFVVLPSNTQSLKVFLDEPDTRTTPATPVSDVFLNAQFLIVHLLNSVTDAPAITIALPLVDVEYAFWNVTPSTRTLPGLRTIIREPLASDECPPSKITSFSDIFLLLTA